MVEADNGMAEPRQKALPRRVGHLATHQMVRKGRRREIGHQHQGCAHQDLLRAGRHAASPFRRVDQTSREFAATATARRTLSISAGANFAMCNQWTCIKPRKFQSGGRGTKKAPRLDWPGPGREPQRAWASPPGSDDHRTAIASISMSQPG